MRVKKEFGFLASVLCALFVCAFAEGATIPLGNSGWAMLTGQCSDSVGVAVDKVDKDNDLVVIELYKTFKNPAESGTFAPIIFDFQKISEDAVSNIVIEDEYILNNTGTEWFDFHMYLLFPIGLGQVGFNPNFIPDGSQLESVSYTMNFGYQGLPVELDFTNTIGGGVPSSPPGEDIFWPGSKSGRIVITTNPQMELGGRFSLKEIPTVPEPGTIFLLGAGFLTTIFRRRRFNDMAQRRTTYVFGGNK